jgi:hypothetical protein
VWVPPNSNYWPCGCDYAHACLGVDGIQAGSAVQGRRRQHGAVIVECHTGDGVVVASQQEHAPRSIIALGVAEYSNCIVLARHSQNNLVGLTVVIE